MPKTEADNWFESYPLDHAYDPGEHEPDLAPMGVDSRRRPDFLPTSTSGERIVCEVKAFGPNRLTKRLQLLRYFSTSGDELWTPVHDQVRAAARTLKPVQPLGLALFVVITNTDPRVFVDLSVATVTSTLLGRGGKLTRDHRYLSAIALLRRDTEERVERLRIIARVKETTSGWDDLSRPQQFDLLLAALDAQTFSEGVHYWLDVIETRSPTAIPLPDHWFAGPRDSRWLLRWRATPSPLSASVATSD